MGQEAPDVRAHVRRGLVSPRFVLLESLEKNRAHITAQGTMNRTGWLGLDLLDDPNGDGDKSDSISKNTVVFFTSDNGGTHAHNLPLKGKKGMLTEGGIRVPLIARWPGTIQPGTVSHRKVHCLDFYPTCLQLAGNKWRPDSERHPLDGSAPRRLYSGRHPRYLRRRLPARVSLPREPELPPLR